MKILNLICFGLAVALMTNVSFAQETSEEGKSCTKQCTASASAVATSNDESCTQCPLTVALKALPAMTYKVGDKAVCCSESAAALAKETDQSILFVVGDRTFDDKTLAYTSLVEATEAFVEKFVTPSTCATSGKTSIAGKSCSCPGEASQRSELVKQAIGDIKMTYVVGETKCACPNQAKALAETSETKTTYVVDGKESCCSLEARLNLARAKYTAAVKALAATEPKTETTSSGSGS